MERALLSEQLQYELLRGHPPLHPDPRLRDACPIEQLEHQPVQTMQKVVPDVHLPLSLELLLGRRDAARYVVPKALAPASYHLAPNHSATFASRNARLPSGATFLRLGWFAQSGGAAQAPPTTWTSASKVASVAPTRGRMHTLVYVVEQLSHSLLRVSLSLVPCYLSRTTMESGLGFWACNGSSVCGLFQVRAKEEDAKFATSNTEVRKM